LVDRRLAPFVGDARDDGARLDHVAAVDRDGEQHAGAARHGARLVVGKGHAGERHRTPVEFRHGRGHANFLHRGGRWLITLAFVGMRAIGDRAQTDPQNGCDDNASRNDAAWLEQSRGHHVTR
jgi:hypothetical protein